MSDKHVPKKTELVRSKSSSLALKKSTLVKRGFELVYKTQKRQLSVAIGNFEKNINSLYTEELSDLINNKYDLKVTTFSFGEELIEFIKYNDVDIAIIIINNIRFYQDYSFKDRIDKTLALITQIKRTFEKPIIILFNSRYVSEEQVKLSGAEWVLPISADMSGLREAFKEYLDMLPKFYRNTHGK